MTAKKDFEKLIFDILNPLKEKYSKGYALLELGSTAACYPMYVAKMASLAYGLIFSPDKLWYPLTDEQKNNYSKWLCQINNLYVPESNWLFFRVLVNVALRKCGREYSEENLSKDLDVIETFYLGDGWYGDGVAKEGNPNSGQKDYYIPFAIHFYSLIYATANNA